VTPTFQDLKISVNYHNTPLHKTNNNSQNDHDKTHLSENPQPLFGCQEKEGEKKKEHTISTTTLSVAFGFSGNDKFSKSKSIFGLNSFEGRNLFF
jgi:hypothetical protein